MAQHDDISVSVSAMVVCLMDVRYDLFPQCVGMGIVLGTGQQRIAAIANLIGYYCIGLPLSITLTFPAKLQVAGLCFSKQLHMNNPSMGSIVLHL